MMVHTNYFLSVYCSVPR